MNQIALAAAAVAFPGLVIFGGVAAALRRCEPRGAGRDAAIGLGLGLVAVVLTVAWFVFADQVLLGRMPVGVYYAFVTAALPEEGFRFLVIRWGLRRRPAVGLLTAMLVGSLVGLTFGTFEHIVYAVDKGWATWLARSFTSVPYHTLSGAVLGYCSAAAMWTRRPWGLVGLAGLVLVHGLADWPLVGPEGGEPDTRNEFLSSGWAGNMASLVVVAVLAAVLVRRASQTDAGPA